MAANVPSVPDFFRPRFFPTGSQADPFSSGSLCSPRPSSYTKSSALRTTHWTIHNRIEWSNSEILAMKEYWQGVSIMVACLIPAITFQPRCFSTILFPKIFPLYPLATSAITHFHSMKNTSLA